MEILRVQNLSFRYPGAKQDTLCKLSFKVPSGGFILLCGESGCGKSTLLKLLKRELAPYGEKSGEIAFEGVRQQDMDDREAAGGIGFVQQNPESQVVTDKVWHELAFGLESLGYSTPVIRRRVAEMASYFGIQEWFRRNTSELSGGQKQMLSLASVMAMQPKLLLLDEPTSQLDPIAAAEFIATLQKLNRELGLTILLVEHRLEEVFPIADRVLVLENGTAAVYDRPENVAARLREIRLDHRMFAALPSAVRIFEALSVEAPCPLTVKDGRRFLTDHFNNLRADRLADDAAAPSAEKALELKDVWFRYEKNLPDVLRGLSLSVYRGEILCVLGGNGTGKTTMLNLMAGLSKAYRGKILIGGKKIGSYPGNTLYRHNLAMLPQNPQTVFLEKTVRKDYEEICSVMGYGEQEYEQHIARIAAQLEITSLLSKHPYDLSGGEQQKAALGKILLLQPQILLLDEPTKGIDAFSKQTLLLILRQLKQQGITVVMVTHDVEFAAQTSDRCALFFDGEIVSADRPPAFFSDNSFYTTAANRISRHLYQNAVTCEDVVALCKQNGGIV